MTRRWMAAPILLLGILAAAPAWSCTYFATTYREDLYFQQRLWRDSDAVFLARATPVGEAQSQLVPVVSLYGRSPPRRSVANVSVNCGEAPSEGVVIAFARRIRASDMPLQPWRWGSWYVMDHRAPAEVVDPKVVEALKDAAVRLKTDQGQ